MEPAIRHRETLTPPASEPLLMHAQSSRSPRPQVKVPQKQVPEHPLQLAETGAKLLWAVREGLDESRLCREGGGNDAEGKRGKGMRGRAHFSGLSEQPQDEGLTGGVSHSARGKREASVPGGRGRQCARGKREAVCQGEKGGSVPGGRGRQCARGKREAVCEDPPTGNNGSLVSIPDQQTSQPVQRTLPPQQVHHQDTRGDENHTPSLVYRLPGHIRHTGT